MVSFNNDNNPGGLSALRQMQQQRQQWLDSKPQNNDWQNELRFMTDDLIIFQFMASGEDGDQFFKVYRAHEFPTVGKNGRPNSTTRYCPVQNEDPNTPCPTCAAEIETPIKERMSMWLYVTDILHTRMPQGKNYPQVNYQGRLYFREEVNAYKCWHTSAWRDSPFGDIMSIGELYKSLHGFTAQMAVTGEGIERRFKIHAIPNSPAVTPELYEQAKAELKPIIDMLREEINVAVQAVPAAQQQAAPAAPGLPFNPVATSTPNPPTIPFAAPGTVAETFSIGGSSSAPTPPTPSPAPAEPVAEQAPPPPPATQAPAKEPAPEKPLRNLFS